MPSAPVTVEMVMVTMMALVAVVMVPVPAMMTRVTMAVSVFAMHAG